MNTPTPETDAEAVNDETICERQYLPQGWVDSDFARKLERERNMWKANHDNQVELRRILMDRPDLKDRAKSISALIAERDQLRKVADDLANATRAEFGELNWRLDAYNNLPHVKKLHLPSGILRNTNTP